MNVAEQLQRARDEVTRLERLVAASTCRDIGCDMQFAGGANCGCEGGGVCSVPVYVCSRCGDSDYGDNEEATRVRAGCQEEVS